MNPVSTLVMALALLFGGAGAVFAFESASQPEVVTTAAAATEDVAPQAASPARPGRRHHRPAVRWAPCPAGSTLLEGTCVTDVVETVALPAPAARPAGTGSGSASGSTRTG